ncbi:EAL domain-containing protein [Sphingomonas sp. XXL09]|uniref:EAL domain-containing protein n=1 Tax=Sphingomonas sp. XXL09 TaxID=3457787 RepID=UPI00406BAEA1
MAAEAKHLTLMIVSPRDHDALAAVAAEDGWLVAAPAAADVQAALAERVRVVLVDGRGGADAGLAASKALGGYIAATGGALVVLLDRPDADALDAHFAAGATHFLAPPSDGESLRQTLRFAQRHVRRAGGRDDGDRRQPEARLAEAEHWIDAHLVAGRHVGVLRIALSRLDILNAARGRAAGDSLIAAARAQVQAIVADLLDTSGLVVAPSGSELVVAAAANPATLDVLAARLDAALARPFAVGGGEAVLGSRWGMAESGAGDDAPRLLHRAGEALAAAKSGDSGMVRIAGPQGAMPLDALAVDLHHAIERGEIDILFQPQAPIDGGPIIGVEALARWRHGRLGSLGADALFAAAERADLGLALSDHIQGLVLRRIAGWTGTLAALRVSLNLTAADLARPGFAASFLAQAAATGVAPDRLTVEITETGAVRDLDAAAGVLRAIRAAGTRVALDDFGTGYSSLAYLAALPLDYLKLDKALAVGGAGQPSDDRGVVRAVMALARSLDLPVIAEGVETEAQRALLAAEGCAYVQGFLLAPPLDEAALIRLLETPR